jgi:hypothetical protein
MKYILTYKLFEENNTYTEGDIVLIRYWAIEDIIPVKIVKKVSNNKFLISFTVKDSAIQNAPEVVINKKTIIGKYNGVDEPAIPTGLSNNRSDDSFNKISNDIVNTNIAVG